MQHILFDVQDPRELGYYELVDSEEALRLTVEWQRENPPENSNGHKFDYAAEDAVLQELTREL